MRGLQMTHWFLILQEEKPCDHWHDRQMMPHHFWAVCILCNLMICNQDVKTLREFGFAQTHSVQMLLFPGLNLLSQAFQCQLREFVIQSCVAQYWFKLGRNCLYVCLSLGHYGQHINEKIWSSPQENSYILTPSTLDRSATLPMCLSHVPKMTLCQPPETVQRSFFLLQPQCISIHNSIREK